MKHSWSDQEVDEHWSLSATELARLDSKTPGNRLGFALLLKYLLLEGRFPADRQEIPLGATRHVAAQLGVHPRIFSDYGLRGRTAKNDRAEIRALLGWRPATEDDNRRMAEWLRQEVLPTGPDPQHLDEISLSWFREERIESPAVRNRERFIRAAVRAHESDFFSATADKLSVTTREALDRLLTPVTKPGRSTLPEDGAATATTLNDLKADPGRPGLESVFKEINKLNCIDQVDLPWDLFGRVPTKIVDTYRRRAATEPPSELRLRVPATRYTIVAAYCWQRRREIIDGLIELLIQIIHRIGVRAELKVERELLEDFRRVRGKTTVLFKMAEAAVDYPEGIIKEVLYPIVGVQTLKDLVREFKATGSAFREVVHTIMRASYSNHYRRMLPVILDALVFRSNNDAHQPVIDALRLLKTQRDSRQQYFTLEDRIPIDGVVRSKWLDIVVETDGSGTRRINRINYEICVLQALRDGLRSKEIWVEGADRYLNPDDDLPVDFVDKRESYYSALDLVEDPNPFIRELPASMTSALATLHEGLPKNTKLHILQRGPHRLTAGAATGTRQPVGAQVGIIAALALHQPAGCAQRSRTPHWFHGRVSEQCVPRDAGPRRAPAPAASVSLRHGYQCGPEAGTDG